MSTRHDELSPIFQYKGPSPRQEEEKQLADIFKYEKPTPAKNEINQQKEPPLSFTQRVAQDISEGEQVERDIERHQARGTSRAIERVIGLPGDLLGFIANIAGEKPLLPSSQDFQTLSERLTSGYTKPQNDFEAKTDEFIGDIASFAIPSSGSYTMARNLGIPLVANLAKEGIKYFGGEDETAGRVKMGTMLALDLLNPKKGFRGANKYIGSLFRAAEDAIPTNAVADATALNSSLTKLRNTLNIGGSAPSKTAALGKIDEIQNLIVNNQISPHQLVGFRKTINELIDSLGGWEIKLPKAIKKRTVDNLNLVKREAIKAGEEYGRTSNPEFLLNWRNANEASAAFQQSKFISNFIENKFGSKFKSIGVKLLFGLPGAGLIISPSLQGLVAGGGATGALTGIYQATKILHQVMNSPTLRKYYSNVIKEAGKNNAAAMVANLELLDKKLLEEEKRKEKRLKELTQ